MHSCLGYLGIEKGEKWFELLTVTEVTSGIIKWSRQNMMIAGRKKRIEIDKVAYG